MKRLLQMSLRTHLIILVLSAVLPAMGMVLYTGLDTRKNMIVLFAFLMLVMAFVGIFGHYLIIRRVNKLVTASRHLADGAPGAQTHLSHDEGELGCLAAAFDKMSADIEKRDQEQNRTWETLKQDEGKYRTLFETMAEGVIYENADGTILAANPAAEMILGLTAEEMRYVAPKDSRWQTVHEDGSPFPEEDHPTQVALQSGRPVNNVVMGIYNPRQEQYRWIIISAIPQFREGEEQPYQVYAVFRDITDRRVAQEAIKVSERLFLTLFNTMAEGVALHRIIRNTEGRAINYEIIDVNKGYETIHEASREEVIHRLATEVYKTPVAPYLDEYAAVVETGNRYNFEAAFEPLDKFFSISVASLGSDLFATIFFDVTERKKAEASQLQMASQLRQAQKMEAIGTLASGIAHDFNNILASIIGYTELAMEASDKATQNECQEQVLVACDRAKNLVRQILSFSRQSKRDKDIFEIRVVVKEALKLLRSTLPTTVEIRQMITTESTLVKADSTQVHQILLNLATNAAYAMRKDGGVLTVLVDVVAVAEGTIAHLPGGPYVRISVGDTGTGIDPSILERIFDPFFTTKQPGEGTGLGLAVVYGIAVNYGGAVTVDSEPGRGSRFDVYLPRLEWETPQDPASDQIDVPLGSENILVVDDEAPIVLLLERTLTSLGYQVETTIRSEEALDRFRHHPERFDLVITDMTMPKMTGAMLAREMLKIRPEMPIILCTGFSEIISKEMAEQIGIRKFLMKPLSRKSLAVAVRDVLDAGTG